MLLGSGLWSIGHASNAPLFIGLGTSPVSLRGTLRSPDCCIQIADGLFGAVGPRFKYSSPRLKGYEIVVKSRKSVENRRVPVRDLTAARHERLISPGYAQAIDCGTAPAVPKSRTKLALRLVRDFGPAVHE